ncbi:MAG: Respiratory-chain dehydrogenase domain 51 kDa subunit [Nitrospirae bacterium]|jgi:NADH-quinone oxidoreductase subunit F/NADP-reducing hydrogenase subunit HndC|nr:Respiratory-chain dehydrogenase domain 51 kDa subunit [Nitrospirota bacterium]MBS1126642.1 Respiratory-chain dehydrogenase domain 51 kDa subunit [Nitrospirota bacterium]MBS1234631.1 Respiratory-chain dehydrogenase domain 51 kDa subunit [Nitrospirota bacterium]
MERLQSIEDLKKLRKQLKEETFKPEVPRVRLCSGTACTATGSPKVVEAIEEEAGKRGVEVDVVKTGCQGLCQKGPVMKVEPQGIFYQKVKPEHAKSILSYTVLGGLPFRQSMYRDSFLSEPIPEMMNVPFYKKQLRIALRNNGLIDPRNIYHYIALGGYAALEKALGSMTPDEVLNEVDRANLRGRGGAGFPAGRKWKHTKADPGKIKFVIANGDEGDPGAFMDRSVMEGDPHSLFEGMLLCAYAIGAEYGMIYVRHEYPLAVKNLALAIKQAEELGLLGKNILGSGMNFTIDIREGAGAFVCGESTALIASLEGERGFPRPRPPRLSEQGGGAWGYPSNLNNIETYACVPPIIEKGADWFLGIGTKNSPGTKVFALTGKVVNTGLVEVPMGITLREIIYEIGGGIMNGKKFKAVQTGGPSGGCIPEEHLDLTVDFDSLAKVGSMMGSGGMVVMDEDNCMVDVAKYFLSFCQSESCGKCPPCRVGTYQMLQILERITSGKGEDGDIERLEEIGKLIKEGALCGLGNSAPNPVLTTIKYFRQEYEEHIHDKYCRSKACSGLGVFRIEHEECFLCGLCKEACAFDAVKVTKDSFFIDQDYCTKCKACYMACPIGAVKVEKQKKKAVKQEVV